MSVELSVLTNVAKPKQRKAVSTVDSSALCSPQDLGQLPRDLTTVVYSSPTVYLLGPVN